MYRDIFVACADIQPQHERHTDELCTKYDLLTHISGLRAVLYCNYMYTKLDLLSHMSGLRAVLTSCTHLLDSASPGEAGRPAGAPDTDWPSFT